MLLPIIKQCRKNCAAYRVKNAAEDAGRSALSIQIIFAEHFWQLLLNMTKMYKLAEAKCRLNLTISSKWHIVETFKVEMHVRNLTADVSKTVSID